MATHCLHQKTFTVLIAVMLGVSLGGCTLIQQERTPYSTQRDKTAKGAGVGAAAGAAAAVLNGEREADEILAGAAIGAAVGGGVGFYLDRQEEKLARIPGTYVERVDGGALLVRFSSTILFDVDSALIRSSGQQSLGEVADVLIEFPKTAVVVQGHTDTSGDEVHNQLLSERRAGSVKNFLIGQGVDSQRTTAVGYGEGYPLATNETQSGRQTNRRVELLLKARAR